MAIKFYAWKDKHKRKKRRSTTDYGSSKSWKRLNQRRHRSLERKAFAQLMSESHKGYECIFPFRKKQKSWEL